MRISFKQAENSTREVEGKGSWRVIIVEDDGDEYGMKDTNREINFQLIR